MRSLVFALAVALAVCATAAPSASASYAPVDQPGPSLSVPPEKLRAALQCTDSVARASTEPVVLIPGTALNPGAEYSWTWEPALKAQKRPYCTLNLPDNAMADIQVAGEYVVYAIRTVHELADKKVEIVGYSQGGMLPRWALRFWPDTRPLVDDVTALAPSNHGTADATAACATPNGCAPSVWQQRPTAAFIDALNSYQETFAGISYTNIYSRSDEIVTPNFNDQGSSSLHGGGGQIANIAVQDVCPADAADHLAMGSYDNTAYRIAFDAITHRGPADAKRVNRTACAQTLMPGVDRNSFASNYAAYDTFIAQTYASYPPVSAEPSLKCYVTASCSR